MRHNKLKNNFYYCDNNRFNLLCMLEENWDSYGAKRVDPNVAVNALIMVDRVIKKFKVCPIVVPTNSGNLQIEFEYQIWDFEIEFLDYSTILMYKENILTGEEFEKEFSI